MVGNSVLTGWRFAWNMLRAGIELALVTTLLPLWLVFALAASAIVAVVLGVVAWVSAIILILKTAFEEGDRKWFI